MALSDAQHLEQLREARDVITAALIEDKATTQVQIRGRMVTLADPASTLEKLNKLIGELEEKVSYQTTPFARVASLSRASYRGS